MAFTVLGHPEPRGSKTPFVPKYKNGEPVRDRNGRVIVNMVDANKKSGPWMACVRAAAHAVYSGKLLAGPIRLWVASYFSRPKCHFGTGRNCDKLKESSPRYHVQTPDEDKVLRGIQDALTGIVYVDDKQVCDGRSVKFWTTERSERAEIVVEELV